MEIRIEPHTLEKAKERGASEKEIIETLQSGTAVKAKAGRLAKSKIFSFNMERLGKFYEEKQIQVIYAIENNAMITVTVYVYYGTFQS
ncbi:DUF4258 domain-containing protein [Flavisolibacter ginsenosidimutans]|uniref:DUF4258 domain-containing protein n=1 Tax=Flavisolibacter ginsenosidimutans TaxID=661481 RepID=A0A5B8UNN0_9BACT|nr:DUF4258 domain-containing protein [Flavisolibacter ginsenosidimutans]QEC58281.1 DUF4258 domain-containing protein [Flavisolibacter ginsenosidimutans]